ncbi:replication-relaxation family protein [Enterococcus avium]|uniref:replication-relaxation family protein n=1 Tax=Enterococcus avium TaxID=33945 RepID=UPI000F50DB81|nr:replication-relaxation family protein [Enterococcus avium]MDT2449871.1 replication-relaxation family protein [Enterococcus avium]ROZ48240.1 hypothetical protein EGX28_02585 [Enterococcus avium]
MSNIAIKALSDKRVELLKLIDKFGVVTIQQILQLIDYSSYGLNQALKRLLELELIDRYQFGKGKVYYITREGSRFIGLINFGYVKSTHKNPYFATLVHDLKVVDCVIQARSEIENKLGEQADIQLTTERELLAEKYLALDFSQKSKNHIRKLKLDERKRIPDFLLTFSVAGERLTNAYEVELTRKSKRALMAKLSWLQFQQQKGIYNSLVYYFEEPDVQTFVATSAQQLKLHVFMKEIK